MRVRDEVVAYIQASDHAVQRAEVCRKFQLAPATAARLLDEIASAGLVDRVGFGRATAYCADPIDIYLRSPERTRKIQSGIRIPYDFNRIRNFSAGSSSFFDHSQIGRLKGLGALPLTVTHEEYLASIHRKMLLETSWASSVLEGNTYSLIDTEELFDRGTKMVGADFTSTQMLLNHKHAIEYLLDNIAEISLSRMDIVNIHSLLSDGLMRDPGDSGRIRYKTVGIGQSIYAPLDVPTQISEELDVILELASEITEPFDQSMYLLANIAYLQPFTDVNKRTSRLASNIPLLKAGLMPMSFFQMSRTGYEKGILHYYETGDSRRLAKEYAACYETSALRFREMIENKPSPDQIRMKMMLRKDISDAVFSIVRLGKKLNELMPQQTITEQERVFFVEYVTKAIKGLNASNVLLYGLTPQDIVPTQTKSKGARPP